MTNEKKARFINFGLCKPDDPIYRTGPIVSGRHINHGLAKPDDPIYTTGPIVAGREILKPHRKMTPDEIERNFKIVRDAITKDGWKPGYVYVNGKWEPPSKQGESGEKGGTT